jgi:short-subunit dehydrogenase
MSYNELIVITGGSGKIGKILAEHFSKLECRVIVVSKSYVNSVDRVPKVDYCNIDLATDDYTELKSLVNNEKIRSLINLAADIGETGKFSAIESSDIISSVMYNLKLLINPMKFCLGSLNNESVIINFSGAGVGSENPTKYQTPYYLSKILTVALSQYIVHESVDIPHIVSVAPGKFNSDFDQNYLNNFDIPVMLRTTVKDQNLDAEKNVLLSISNLTKTIDTILNDPQKFCGSFISAQRDQIFSTQQSFKKKMLIRGDIPEYD